MATADEVERVIKRIDTHPGVLGSIITNSEGVVIHSTMDNSTTQQYLANCSGLAQMARCAIRDLDPQNDLKFLRVRSRKCEIMIAPESEYSLIVIQAHEGDK